MKNKWLSSCLAAVSLAFSLGASADDIDLFVQPTPTDAAARPNILIILDNTANWNTAFENEKAALVNTFGNLPVDTFNVGLMMFGDSPEMGYVRAAIRPMSATNRAAYAALIDSLDVNGDKANARTLGRTISEAYRYLKGMQTVDPSKIGSNAKRDFPGNNAGSAQSQAIYALPGNALSSASATVYNSPLSPTSCSRTYIIYIGNNVPSGNVTQDNTSRNTASGNELAAAGGSKTQIPLQYTSHQTNFADEWARFLKQDMSVTFFTVDVDPTPMPGGHSGGMGNSALLASMASVSGGKYFRVNSSVGGGAEISDALNRIFSEIQAVNSVFASVSLPVSIENQGTYRNQVYVGLFRPDANAYPRWPGNLKQYKLGFSNGDLRLQDVDDNRAINPLTGFITECARSYWTPSTPDTYWSFNPMGDCIPPPGSAEDLYMNSNFPDGGIVEKGAHAYVRRSSTTRTLKTCSENLTSCTTLTDFDTGNGAISQSLLGAGSSAERITLIDWARGLDIDDENMDGASSTAMRPSVHGDVVHSRPVAVNFGTDAAPKVVVFYGGNDGVFRAINGNRSEYIGTVPPGGELWGFVPPEFYQHIKRLRDNDIQVDFPNITDPDALPKPYGMDGSVTTYREGSTAWIYATMRRGGRAVYAFNVNTSDPSDITLKWKRGCDSSGCNSGFDNIGQTWSSPVAFKAQGYSSPMLIMGGGYDTCEDADPNTCSSPRGSEVYVLDADTGALLTTLDTDRSVVSDVVIVPNAVTGLAQYAYVADLGGNVYRVNIGTSVPSAWTIQKIASLGCSAPGTCAAHRKFMFAPDVVPYANGYVLLLGSGDREKPLLYSTAGSVTNSVPNYFFMLKDNPADPNWLSSEAANCGGASVICLDSLMGITTSDTPAQSDLETKKGWYLGLHATEQVVTTAITIFGTVTFSTHQPAVPQASSCTTNLGTARVYNIWYANAASTNGTNNRFQELPPVGLPPSPVAGMVTLDDGQEVAFCIGCSADSPLETTQPQVPPASLPNHPKGRVYWYIQR